MRSTKNWLASLLAGGGLALAAGSAPAEPLPDANALYQHFCSTCHGAERLGGVGPALLPENLRRLRKPAAHAAIADGLPATQMPGFGEALSEADIAALVKLIYTPLEHVPEWTLEEMAATRLVYVEPGERLSDTPLFDAEPENIFLVVETGDHHVTVLDGDRFEPIYRFQSRHALHGGPKYSPDGRYVFISSRDGWISRFDLYNLKMTHEVRAGINGRNVALSADGRYVLAGNYLPHTAVLLDAEDLTPLQRIEMNDSASELTSRVSAVYQSAPRDSFILALRDVPEIWELFYDPKRTPEDAKLLPGGDKGRLALRRIRISEPMDDFFFDPDNQHLIGAARDAGRAIVVDLDAGKVIDTVSIDGLPHLASGITWEYRGRMVMASPLLHEGAVSVIDMQSWEEIKRIDTLGPGFFLRSHENSRYAWVDVFFGEHRDVMHVIDKETLEIVRTLRPEPGRTAAHVEFTRDGSHALVSLWENDGALMVFDAETFEEVKRLPMRRPSGKYNVSNKIYRSPGTSH